MSWPSAAILSASTSASRLAALRNIFPQVESIDIQPFTEALPFFQHVLTNQWFESASVRALNKAIVESARKLMPNLVWIDRGLHVYPETLQALRARGNAQLIHFSPDSHQILGNQSRHFLRGIPLYDVIVTTKPRDVAVYRAAGAQTVELMQKAFDPAIHRPIEIPPQEQEKYGCDVAYIGHWGSVAGKNSPIPRGSRLALESVGRRLGARGAASVVQGCSALNRR